MSGHPHRATPSGGTPSGDSAGAAWAGRRVTAAGDPADDGRADPGLARALAARAGAADLVEAVRAARLLVPVVATGGGGPSAEGSTGEEPRDEVSLVTLRAPDGTAALPAFTSLDRMAAWDPRARPVPVDAARAAAAALSEGCAVLVLDVGSDDAREVRTSMLCALAEERDWHPPEADPVVAERVAAAVAGEPAVVAHELGEGRPEGRGVLAVAVVLRDGTDADEARAVLSRVAGTLGGDALVRSRVDGLTFAAR